MSTELEALERLKRSFREQMRSLESDGQQLRDRLESRQFAIVMVQFCIADVEREIAKLKEPK